MFLFSVGWSVGGAQSEAVARFRGDECVPRARTVLGRVPRVQPLGPEPCHRGHCDALPAVRFGIAQQQATLGRAHHAVAVCLGRLTHKPYHGERPALRGNVSD